MVALDHQFAALATFCSLAAVSLFPLSVNAVAIQGRAPSSHVEGSKPGHYSPAASIHAVNRGNSQEHIKLIPWKGKQRERRTLDWSPITNVIRMADMAISSAKHSRANVKRHAYNAQAHFHERDVSRREKRKSSVIIPKNRGGSYLVSPSSRSLHAGQSKTTKRGEISEGRSGRIDLMSPTSDNPRGKKVASLLIEESEDHEMVLNASEDKFTPADLVNAPPGSSHISMPSGEDSDVLVYLQFPLLGTSQSNSGPYCATTNGRAGSKEPQRMTVEKCFDKVKRDSDEQKSQTFAYNEKTQTIRPMWVMGQEDNKSDDPTTPNKAGVAGVTNVIDGRDDADSAKNVTLVFVPNAPEVTDAEDDIVTTTSTMTTTITVTSMSAATPSAIAADVEPTSTVEASVTSSSVPSGSAVASMNMESSMPMSAPVASAAALDVQIVGPNSTSSNDPAVASTTLTSDSAAPTTSMAAQDVESSSSGTSATVTSDPTTSTTSVNAADVAENIAASGASSSAAPASTAIDDTSSATGPTAAAIESPLASETVSSAASTMTPVSTAPTAPYQMAFKADSRL